MPRMTIHIVHYKVREDYEILKQGTHVYHFKSNAENDFKQVVENDFKPIIQNKNYKIFTDDNDKFEAGTDGRFDKNGLEVELITTEILDYHLCESK